MSTRPFQGTRGVTERFVTLALPAPKSRMLNRINDKNVNLADFTA